MLNSVLGNQLKNEILLTIDKISITSLLPSICAEVSHQRRSSRLPPAPTIKMQPFLSGGRCICMTLPTCNTYNRDWKFSLGITEVPWVLIIQSVVGSHVPLGESSSERATAHQNCLGLRLTTCQEKMRVVAWAMACMKCFEGWVWFASRMFTAEQQSGWQIAKMSSEWVPTALRKHP